MERLRWWWLATKTTNHYKVAISSPPPSPPPPPPPLPPPSPPPPPPVVLPKNIYGVTYGIWVGGQGRARGQKMDVGMVQFDRPKLLPPQLPHPPKDTDRRQEWVIA